MAQYVHNFVFFSSEAKETVMSKETIYKLSGRYEELITPLKYDYFLVVFDTYGPENTDNHYNVNRNFNNKGNEEVDV